MSERASGLSTVRFPSGVSCQSAASADCSQRLRQQRWRHRAHRLAAAATDCKRRAAGRAARRKLRPGCAWAASLPAANPADCLPARPPICIAQARRRRRRRQLRAAPAAGPHSGAQRAELCSFAAPRRAAGAAAAPSHWLRLEGILYGCRCAQTGRQAANERTNERPMTTTLPTLPLPL